MKNTNPKADGAPPLRAAIVSEGQLRASVLTVLPQVLRELGQDPGQMLREAGVDAGLLDDPENTLPFRAVGALLEHCVARTGCRHLGFLIGQRSRISMLGVVGLLVEHSPDVGTALHSLVQHLHLHDRGAIPTFAVGDSSAMLGYVIYEKEVPAPDQIYAASLTVACNIMRALCGTVWNPAEVRFPFRKPGDLGPLHRYFRAPLRFDADQATLVFPATWLARPVLGADPEIRKAAEALAATLRGRQQGTVVAQVRRALCALLVAGRASAHEVALAFAIHRRTLNRRLEGEGTTFRQLLDEVRLDIARQLLRNTETPVGEIASRLAYGSASAFSRAFKRCCGSTPAEWRSRYHSS